MKTGSPTPERVEALLAMHLTRGELQKSNLRRLPLGIQELVLNRTRRLFPNSTEILWPSNVGLLRRLVLHPEALSFFLMGVSIAGLVTCLVLPFVFTWGILAGALAAVAVYPALTPVRSWARRRRIAKIYHASRFLPEHRILMLFVFLYTSRKHRKDRWAKEELAELYSIHDTFLDLLSKRDVLAKAKDLDDDERAALEILDVRMESTLRSLVAYTDKHKKNLKQAAEGAEKAERSLVAARVLAEDAAHVEMEKLREQ